MPKILVIDDDTYMSNLLKNYLEQNKYDADMAYTAKSGLEKFEKKGFDLVLCDYRLPDKDGLYVLNEMRDINPDIPVIMITAYADVQIAIRLIKRGAVEYIVKPINQEELLHLIKKTISSSKDNNRENGAEFISGESRKMEHLMGMIEKVAPTDMTVLIEGETGSGKEYIARRIHQSSQRNNKPFLAVDCGAIPKDIANSELFGHVKGSFTGAISDKKGVFEQAHKGSLFLDEIGNLSFEVQTKLLRALQERVITCVGETKEIPVDVRIIVATNDELHEVVKESNFREDLYHRINEFKIKLPPLRERKEDILLFSKHFIEQANKELKKNCQDLDQESREAFLKYPWYGNLREMRNVIKRSVLLSDGEYITADTLPDEIRDQEGHAGNFAGVHVSADPDILNLKDAAIQAEKEIILNALKKSNYNKSQAAKILNIDRKTLYNKIKQFQIQLEH